MNIRQMAMINTLKIVGGIVLIAVAVNLAVIYLSLAVAGTILALAFFVYMIKFMYDIELSKLESQNALDKLKDAK